MREGFYKVDYAAGAGDGFALLALDSGRVVGADCVGGLYDGSYEWNGRTELLVVVVTARIPEGESVVQGHVAGPGGLEFKVYCSFPREPDGQIVEADTTLGPVALGISLLRAFE